MDLLSSNKYIALPPFSQPKVILAVDNPRMALNSLKLYRVYSAKAIFLKKLIRFLSSIGLISLFSKKSDKSEFASFLEETFSGEEGPLVLSRYVATDGDKAIFQIQAERGVIGYLKYALNEAGREKLERELEGMEVFAQCGIKSLEVLKKGSYQGFPFFVSEEVEESIEQLNGYDFGPYLNRLKREERFPLANHPRIEQMRRFFEEKKLPQYGELLEELVRGSEKSYALAYEHGDFCPWNVLQDKDEIRLFDLEYFEKDGIEDFDLIAYHFRVATHLQGLDGSELFRYIQKEVAAQEGETLFKLFLLKEVMETYTLGRTHMVDIEALLRQKF